MMRKLEFIIPILFIIIIFSQNVSAQVSTNTALVVGSSRGTTPIQANNVLFLPGNGEMSLYVVCIMGDDNVPTTWPGGFAVQSTIQNFRRHECGYAFTNVSSITISSSAWDFSYVIYQILGADSIMISQASTGNDANPSPPTLSPFLNNDNYLSIVEYAWGNNIVASNSAYPSGYLLYQNTISSDGGTTPGISIASKKTVTSSNTPTSATVSAPVFWVGTTFLITPKQVISENTVSILAWILGIMALIFFVLGVWKFPLAIFVSGFILMFWGIQLYRETSSFVVGTFGWVLSIFVILIGIWMIFKDVSE